MKTKTKIITGAGGAVFLGMMWQVFKPEKKILSSLSIRVDSQGNGNYGASRTPPYKIHKGLDLVATPGEKVYAPFSGTAVLLDNVYPNSKYVYRGIKIFTDTKLEVDVLYIIPTIKHNDTIKKGQLIGFAQDISLAHSSAMKPHIHIEHKDRASNVFIDPTNYYFPNQAARTATTGESIIDNPSET